MRGVTGLGRNKGKERNRNRHVKGHARTSEREREERGRETNMPGGQAPPAGAASAVLLGYARLDDATVSRSLFPHVFTRVNIVYTTRRAKGYGLGGPARPCYGDELR
jgi:hypothetical protein